MNVGLLIPDRVAELSPSDQPFWLIITIACIPAVAAIGSAILAARFARAASTSEANARRVSELESRLASRKYETYKPMLDVLRRMLDQQLGSGKVTEAEFKTAVSEFAAWVVIFGTDDAVTAFQRFMHCTYASAPPPVLMRHYAEFLLAVRRDIGYPESTLTGEHTLGIRFKDLYEEKSYEWVTMPLPDLYARENWEAPWSIK